MNCPACTRAAINPLTPHYGAKCIQCAARALAQHPKFFEAWAAQHMTPDYVAALEFAFGFDYWEAHKIAKAWAERIKAARQHKETA